MLSFYPVTLERELPRDHLLHVSQFFDLRGMWWRTRKQRQGMVISIAIGWYQLVKDNPAAYGYLEEEIFLTALSQHVGDAKSILERFFVIKRLGYNFGQGTKSPTIVSPVRLSPRWLTAVEEILRDAVYDPGTEPTGNKAVVSQVTLTDNASSVLPRLRAEKRLDLIPAVVWLLKQGQPIKFYFEPAGQLRSRDKSIWPVRGIEGWPGWLRADLFGLVVDLENAYCQFIVQQLTAKYADNPLLLELQYPDLLRADRDKVAFRWGLCKLLSLEPTDENVSGVKKLVMAIANGSNVTPGLLTSGSGMSEAVKIVHELAPHLLPTELYQVGLRLSAITKQFKQAKKDLCLYLLNERPTRSAQKKIFTRYFEWERESRYAIWEACGRTGLMLHDGIDGVQTDLTASALADRIVDQTSLKVSVE